MPWNTPSQEEWDEWYSAAIEDYNISTSEISEAGQLGLYDTSTTTSILSFYEYIQGINATMAAGVESRLPTQENAPGIGGVPTTGKNVEELQRMLESYKGRTSLIQVPQRQKAMYTIDRFDGGLNLNKSPRDLSYWESCQMNELSPAKIGRLVRLGDFKTTDKTLTGADATWQSGNQNYGVHYLKMSNSIADGGAPQDGSPTEYAAILNDDGSGTDQIINLVELASNDNIALVTALGTACKPVFHDADNRLYVSDANFSSGTAKTYVGGMSDRPSLFPYTDTSVVSYCLSGDSAANVSFAAQDLYPAAPTAGVGNSNICVSDSDTGLTHLGSTGDTGGIYINIEPEDMTGDTTSKLGWGADVSDDGATPSAGSKFYKFYASFLYDNGSETKLTNVTTNNNSTFNDAQKVEFKTTPAGEPQTLVVKQVKIDGTEFVTNYPRIHGARFYYTEVDGTSADPIGDDKYLWAELDFRYGLKLMSEFGHWNIFEEDTTADALQAIQVDNASESSDTAPEGTLSIDTPPTAYTFWVLNLFNQEEIKADLMWKTSTVGNGVAFIGNIKYDGKEYPGRMLYSGAGEVESGSPYPMWGTFPVDSNRIDIPDAGGEITALKWTNNRVLQFRKNIMYLVNVEEVITPRVEGVYQGMGVDGQYAVTETAYGCAWVNSNGVYSYNTETGKVGSLTLGRLDTEDFGADSDTKIGYDDRAKMLIIGNYTRAAAGTNGYHYAYSFITDAWCTWNTNKTDVPQSNFAINHAGYLTGYLSDYIKRWNSTPTSAVAVDYITKDIDFGKPNLDKRLYTLYISYTGGDGQSALNVSFRVNGKEGADLSNGWIHLQTVQDYTDPYFTTSGTAWADSSGTPATGDPTINIDTGLNSTSTGEVQKLAKINLRHLGATDTVDITDTDIATFPADYLKFARSIQFRFQGTADENFEINDISLVYKEKRLK